MKKFDLLKTINLIVFILLFIITAVIVFTNDELFHIIAADKNVRLMCIILWLTLGLSFFFIFMDFNISSKLKHEYRELDYAVHSDPVAGIANRFSSDALIEKYAAKKLPEDFGAVMIVMNNIKEINNLYGRTEGNMYIKNFANVLSLTSLDLCFVARNGGDRFLAIFENCTYDKIDNFLSRLNNKVKSNNANSSNYPMEYTYGIAFNKDENVDSIVDLIALSNERANVSADISNK